MQNNVASSCRLRPCELRLLKACFDNETENAQELAERLILSEGTVETYFKRIRKTLDTHSRCASVIRAVRSGWLVVAPLAGENPEPSNDSEKVSP